MLNRTFYLFAGALIASSLCAEMTRADILVVDASADTYLREGQASQGAVAQLLAGATGATSLTPALFRFDLSNPLLTGAGVTINSVTLTTVSDGPDNGSGSVTVDVFELTAANADWVESFARWTGKASGQNWAGSGGASTAGTDYINTVLASLTADSATIVAGTAMAFTSSGTGLSDAVAGGIGGDLSLLVRNNSTERDFLRIRSKEFGDGSSVATLTIDYVVPEPATLGLMGLGLLFMSSRPSKH